MHERTRQENLREDSRRVCVGARATFASPLVRTFPGNVPAYVMASDSGQPPAAFFICELQTPENVRTRFSRHFPKFVSESSFSCGRFGESNNAGDATYHAFREDNVTITVPSTAERRSRNEDADE